MKKIFILTGEPSGDKLASKIISKLKKSKPNIEYLSLGGENLKALGIKSIYDLNKVTYLGFTNVLMNIFSIKKKISDTANEIIRFKPNILFTVDSPDFTLRVAELVKKMDKNIKIIHLVAPQVWIWREHRTKKLKKFLDHILLLFPFEKKYFDKEQIKSTFVGHPLIENNITGKIDLSHIIKDKKFFFSIFPGSRSSELKMLIPILFDFVKMMNQKYDDLFFVFHSTKDNVKEIQTLILNEGFKNCGAIADEKIKFDILKSSVFAVAKSGTVSLEICNAKIPSIIIYKMNIINYLIVKMLVKVKFANIINIFANKEIIPELLQGKCNSKDIFNLVYKLLNDRESLNKQISESETIINKFKTNKSAELSCDILINYL
jgi:lipid-A-disaccharide synthase